MTVVLQSADGSRPAGASSIEQCECDLSDSVWRGVYAR